jgi:hypothetical protein
VGGPNSGRFPRKSITQHLTSGTYRADRHGRGASLPAEFVPSARRVLKRLLAAGDLFMSRAEEGGKNASRSLNAAAKCLALAMSYSRLLGDAPPTPKPPDKLAAHLAQRANIVPLTRPKEGERR